MRRAGIILGSIGLVLAGTAFAAGHPQWGELPSYLALLVVLAALVAVGVFAVRSRAESSRAGKSGGQKMSGSLVTLSSAAILAVYAAGYHRTGFAEDKFQGQSARRRTVSPIAARLIVPAVVSPKLDANRAAPTPSAATAAPKKISPRPTRSAIPDDSLMPGLAELPGDASESSSSRALSSIPVIAPPPPRVAATNVPPPAPAAPAPAAQASGQSQGKLKDGTYSGFGRCRHGDIVVAVVIQSGKIASSEITSCLTRYPCSWIQDLPGQVVAKQTPDVDIISGASESSYAFSDAVTDALTHASQ